jgi:hypothetical protein
MFSERSDDNNGNDGDHNPNAEKHRLRNVISESRHSSELPESSGGNVAFSAGRCFEYVFKL